MPKLRQKILILKNGLLAKSVFCLCFSFFARGKRPWYIHQRPYYYQQQRQPKEEIFFAEHGGKHFEHGIVFRPRKEEKIRTEPLVHKVNRHGNGGKYTEYFRQPAKAWAKAVCQNEHRVHYEHDMYACGMKVHSV